MSFQGTIENLVKVFLGFYIACSLVGRADIPWKMVSDEVHVQISKSPIS